MPNVGTGTLTEFGIALDVGENYRWLLGEEDRVNEIGGGVGVFEFQRYFYWVSENSKSCSSEVSTSSDHLRCSK